MNCTSHTIVRNGMPFIGRVLTAVEPFMERMFLTLSEKCSDATEEEIMALPFKDKLEIEFENVKLPGELTHERQKQLDKTETEWVLFLDSDDQWFEDDLERMMEYLKADVDGYAVNPYQVVNERYYDESWENKWFTKWFRKQPGVHYRHPWPRDLIYKNDEMLYWKTNLKVPRIPIRYFHLSNLMDWKFRDELWATEYKGKRGKLTEYPKEEKSKVKRIFAPFYIPK